MNNAHTKVAGNAQGWLLILCSMMPVMAVVSLVPIMPLLGREFGRTPGASFLIPIALTIPALCVAIFSPIAGTIADKVGRRPLLLWTLFFYACFGLAPLVLSDLRAIVATRIGVGISEAVIVTVAATLIGDYFSGPRRESWIALQTGALSIAATILIFLGGVLGEFGWRGPFALYGIALVLLVATAALIWEPAKTHQPAEKIVSAGFPWSRALLIAGLQLFGAILFYTYIQLGTILGMSGVESSTMTGVAGAIANVAFAVGSYTFKRMSASGQSLTRLLPLGFGLAGIGLIALSSVSGFGPVVAAVCMTMLGTGLLVPTFITWMLRQMSAEHRGRGMGLWSASFFLGQFLSPIIIVALNGTTGGLLASIQVLGGVGLLATLLLPLLPKRVLQS